MTTDERLAALDQVDALHEAIEATGIPVPARSKLLAAEAREQLVLGNLPAAQAKLLELQQLALAEAKDHLEIAANAMGDEDGGAN